MATIPKGKGHAFWKAVKKSAETDDPEGYASVAKSFKKELGGTLDKFDKAVEKAKADDVKKYAAEVTEILDAYKKALMKHKDDMGKSFTPLNMTLSGLKDYVVDHAK